MKNENEAAVQQDFSNLMLKYPNDLDEICQNLGIRDRGELKGQLTRELHVDLLDGLNDQASVIRDLLDWLVHQHYQWFVLDNSYQIRLMNAIDIDYVRAELRIATDG